MFWSSREDVCRNITMQEELERLKEGYLNDKTNQDCAFKYASGLIHSEYKEDIKEGIGLFDDLIETYPDIRRDSMYFKALGHYLIGDMRDAMDTIQKMLENEPENAQALYLRDRIVAKIKRDGMYGMAILGGAAALISYAIYSFRRKKKD